MKTLTNLLLAVLLCLAIASCGGGSTKRSSAAGSSAGGPSTPAVPIAAPTVQPAAPVSTTVVGGSPAMDFAIGADLASGLAHVRVLGAGAGAYTSVLLSLKVLEVKVDGVPTTIDFSQVAATFDLANTGHAWLAGKFPMPPPGSTVHVKLVFDEAGVYGDAGGAGEIRACGPAIEFDAPAEWFALRGHAVITIDLVRSLPSGAGGVRLLLPNLQVQI